MASTWLAAQQLESENAEFVYVPHSTSKNHGSDENKFFSNWLEWEKDNYNKMSEFKSVKIAAIGDYMENHLEEEYQIENEFIELRNGIHPKLYDYELSDYFEEYNLQNKTTFIAFGRSEQYKGLRSLIEMYNLDAQLVVIASDQTSLNPDQSLKDFEKQKENVRVIDNFLESEALYSLISDERTRAVITPSKCEPFGLIPEEVRILPGNTLPVASNIDGLKHQIIHGEDGFLFDPDDYGSLNEILNQLLQMNDKQINELNEAGEKKLWRKYDYRKNLLDSVKGLS